MPSLAPTPASAPAAAGSAEFARINRAMLCAGFAAFALLYCVQPLMPELGAQFALTPAQSSWSLSVATLALAVSLVLSGVLSDRIGRKQLMIGALVSAAVLTALAALAHTFTQLLVLRALAGFALGGMPAVAMAYLSEEIEAPSLGLSMGIYIGGTAFGGTFGRMASSFISEHYSWRLAMAVMGVAGLAAGWEFWRSLPQSWRFQPGRPGWRALADGASAHLSDAGLRWLFVFGFLVMGVFVSLYNYISFLLLEAPYSLSESAVGAVSILYLVGIGSAMWAGRLADRMGRRHVLWIAVAIMFGGLLLTLAGSLVVIIAGLALFTFGFFASHSVASSWVGRRAGPPQALASALYLFFYYLGSSVLGSLCGTVWSGAGWAGVVALLALVLALAVAVAVRLRALAPLPTRAAVVEAIA